MLAKFDRAMVILLRQVESNFATTRKIFTRFSFLSTGFQLDLFDLFGMLANQGLILKNKYA